MRIETDGSGTAIGAVLTQESPNGYQVVAYVSRRLTKSESNYTISEIELLAIIFAIERFDSYISRAEFEVITDHSALVDIFDCLILKIELPGGLFLSGLII